MRKFQNENERMKQELSGMTKKARFSFILTYMYLFSDTLRRSAVDSFLQEKPPHHVYPFHPTQSINLQQSQQLPQQPESIRFYYFLINENISF